MQFIHYFFKWANPGFFLFIFVLFSSQLHENWKKCRWCAWDSNWWLQDGRRRRNHGAMADAQFYFIKWSKFSYNEAGGRESEKSRRESCHPRCHNGLKLANRFFILIKMSTANMFSQIPTSWHSRSREKERMFDKDGVSHHPGIYWQGQANRMGPSKFLCNLEEILIITFLMNGGFYAKI